VALNRAYVAICGHYPTRERAAGCCGWTGELSLCFGNTTGWFHSSAAGSIKAESALWTLRGLADGHFCRSLSLIRMRGGAGVMLFTGESPLVFSKSLQLFHRGLFTLAGGHKTRGWTMFWNHTWYDVYIFKYLYSRLKPLCSNRRCGGRFVRLGTLLLMQCVQLLHNLLQCANYASYKHSCIYIT